VRKLEVEYDVRLFNRGKKLITLTGPGEKLFEITRRMFAIEEQVLEFLSESRAIKTGQLKIIADSTHHVTGILELFRQRYPSVFISISVGNSDAVIASLDGYDADIGVLGDRPAGREYRVIKLSSTPIIAFAAANSEIGQLKSIRFDELAILPLVMREQGSKTRAKFEDYARQSAVDLHVSIEAEGREAVREIVASGNSVGIVSEAEFGKDARFVKIPISDANLTMDETLVCLRERQESRLIRTFMQVAHSAIIHN